MNYEKIKIFDIEIYQNFFCIGVLNYSDKKFNCYKLSQYHDDWEQIISFWRESMLIGYNNIHYDNIMMNYIIERITEMSSLSTIEKIQRLYTLNEYLFNNKEDSDFKKNISKYKYANNYEYIDMMEVIREGLQTKSLKGVGVNLRHEKLQELPYAPSNILTLDQMNEVEEYNLNDCIITMKVFDVSQVRIEMRELIGNVFNVNLITSSDSGIAKEIFKTKYCELANVEWNTIKDTATFHRKILIADIIRPWVKFRTREAKEFLERISRKEIICIEEETSHNPFTSIEWEFKGVLLTIAKGGIHSVDEPGIFESNDEYDLVDIDVASWYPRLMLNNKRFPAHLNQEVVYRVLNELTDMRLDAKSKAKVEKIFAAINEGLKISINTFYGLLGRKGVLFDEFVKYMVTINGELGLIMLIEDLYLHGLQTISVNTDGVVIKLRKSDRPKLNRVVEQWENKVNAKLEFTEYSKYIRKDINNYMCIKKNGEIKAKGRFVPQLGILKGFEQPVLGFALQEYYLNGTLPEQYFRYHLTRTDLGYDPIYDYCFSQKIADDFDNVLQDVDFKYIYNSPKTGKPYKTPKREIIVKSENILQRYIRFYVSNNGYRIIKRRKSNGQELEYSGMTGFKITLFNDYFKSDNYDINYDYYVEEAYKIINKIKNG